MATPKTLNFGLWLPASGQRNVATELNANWEKIDSELGKRGDILSTLSQSQVTITGTTIMSSDAFGIFHVCSASSAKYTITLPPASGCNGQLIGFRVLESSSFIISLAGEGSSMIGPQSVRKYVHGETVILLCDGTDWVIVTETLALVSFSAYVVAAQSMPPSVNNLVHHDTVLWDIGNHYDNVSTFAYTPDAPGVYSVGCGAGVFGLLAQKNLWTGIRKNATVFKWFQLVVVAATTNPSISGETKVSMNGETDNVTARLLHTNPAAANVVNTNSRLSTFTATRISREEV